MFQQSQNEEYLDLCVERVKNVYLEWVEQFCDIIEEKVGLSNKRINDIGCNVGQFWKGIKRREANIVYNGYDIEDEYLSCAKKIFPEIDNNLHLLDVTSASPDKSDITVCSATIEHFEYLMPGLGNLLRNTEQLVVLRTFLGETALREKCIKPHAKTFYWINQYSFLEMCDTFDRFNFDVTIVRDRYTDSMPKLISPGIIRTQYVLVGIKRF